MARYEQTSLGDPDGDITVGWTTRYPDHPFTITKPYDNEDVPPEVISLTNREARDLALFLTKYLLEYVE